jgi:hypothetical protein
MELENLYSYAFLETPSLPLILPQGAATQVVLIKGTNLSAIVEPGISLESFQDNDEKIIEMALCHDRVICELFQQITVLPVQFGICFNSEKNLLIHLESNTEKYRQQLQTIHGKTEFTLKLTPVILEEVPPVTARGKDYFIAKKQQYQHQRDFSIAQAQEKQYLIDLITTSNNYPVVVKEKDQEVTIHMLVNIEDKNLFLEQTLNWQKACPRWNLSLGDPLPPYHFI